MARETQDGATPQENDMQDVHDTTYARLRNLLVGARIAGLRFEADAWGGAPWPVMTLVKGGKRYEVSVTADPEGNGGGWLDEHHA